MEWHVELDIKMTRKQLEQRRYMAAKDLESGMSQADVARKYNVAESSVSRWAKSIRENGKNGLKKRKATGRKTKLTDLQKQELAGILSKGALASDFQTNNWTGKRVSAVIKKNFGVEYHYKHIPKLLRSMKFRKVKPKRKAMERDEEKRIEWLGTTWEEIKKK
jgi:transposase